MIGLVEGTPCPECGCALPTIPAAALRTAERRSHLEALIFVVVAAVLQTALLSYSFFVLPGFWLLQMMAAAFVVMSVVSTAARRRFWRSTLAKMTLALGAWLTLMLAPLGLACLLFIGWVAIR